MSTSSSRKWRILIDVLVAGVIHTMYNQQSNYLRDSCLSSCSASMSSSFTATTIRRRLILYSILEVPGYSQPVARRQYFSFKGGRRPISVCASTGECIRSTPCLRLAAPAVQRLKQLVLLQQQDYRRYTTFYSNLDVAG